MARGDEGLVCGRCWVRLQRIEAPQCGRCGHPRLRAHCGWCELLPAYVRAVRSVCWFPGGSATRIVYALKYGHWPGVAPAMARRMARLAWPADVPAERVAVVPVPLAASRLRERGYNQSECLARELASCWSIALWSDVLVRVRATRTQARLTPGERLTNVARAFRAPDGAEGRLSGAHLVLVDDVVTTAATLNACAAALIDGGARIISYVTFGRARTDAGRPT